MNRRILQAIARRPWPSGSLDNLLRAATLSDLGEASLAWRSFEASADFDNLRWGEFRLISLLAHRIADLAPESALRPRIAGIERSIWSRSQLTIGEASPVLRALRKAAIEILVFKGASRAAMGGAAARGRSVNDIDICVRPDDVERAFDILVENGWSPAGSGTVLFHRHHLPDAVGINLVRGRFGNLDLHRTPFHAPYDRAEDDAAIWARSSQGRLGYADVRIPGPTDAIVIAVTHGALDAHKSSDWLADVALSIDMGVDWDLLGETLERRRAEAAGAVVLGYAKERLQKDVPEVLLNRLLRAARMHPVRAAASIAEISPKSEGFSFAWAARLWAKQGRLFRLYRKTKRRNRIVLASLLPAPSPRSSGATALEQVLRLPDREPGKAWTGSIVLHVAAELPALSRRIDYEVNSQTRHHVRLRALMRDRGPREASFRFRFRLSLAADESDPVIVAAPSRRFNEDAPDEMVERYRAIPFRIERMKVRRSS